MAVTVIGLVLETAPLAAVIVICEDPAPTNVEGGKATDTPAGNPLAVRLMAPLKALRLPRFTV